jgi:flagellar assembly factor FliW
MKVLSNITPIDFGATSPNEILLPSGLIGFRDYKRAELLYMPDHLPFLWMHLHGPDTIHFVVIEPGGIVAGYEPEIFDDDAEQMEISDPAEAMVLNIVTLRHQNPVEASVNLVGPVIVNRRTRLARQVVISNYSRYSAHHPLVGHSAESSIARTA